MCNLFLIPGKRKIQEIYIHQPLAVIFGRLAGAGFARQEVFEVMLVHKLYKIFNPHASNVGAGGEVHLLALQNLYGRISDKSS